MSVIVSNRGQNQLIVISLGMQLCADIIKLTKNQKYFKSRYRQQVNIPLCYLAKQFYHNLVLANSRDLYQQYEQRVNFQNTSADLLELINSDLVMYSLNFASQLCIIKLKNIIQKIKKQKKLLAAWINSDKDRRNKK